MDESFARIVHRYGGNSGVRTLYALDSSTIDLCLSLFGWAPFFSTKAAIKLHTLLDLRGSIPAFIHISDGKLHDVNVLDMLTYVLIAIVKKELQFDASLYTCLQILSVSVFEKTQLSCALHLDDSGTKLPVNDNQLILFNF